MYLILSGLFERHKLLFSFNMTIKIEQAEDRAPQEELEFFLKGQCSYYNVISGNTLA